MILRPICGAVALLLSLNCAAELRVKSPAQICRLLADTQLRAGDWRQDDTGSQGCSSGTRPVSADVPAGSQIGYAAEGADDIPTRVTLTLGGISKADDDLAKRELVRASKRLAVRVLGLSMPHSAEESIMKGAPAKLEFGSGTLTIIRTAKAEGRYEMKVVMQ
ncbi:hypothetical protein IFT62_09700 [Pseudomonas lutea]|uniref:Lipoprotein n=1 Tax=Pseudomonas lutea TaxID=243924 RepID=A0ABR9A670_9PSED|nr:hypothetical protein [Pseudomonas lutea]MBD8121486.1 hypothetical protein [Pseudomonas lutea]